MGSRGTDEIKVKLVNHIIKRGWSIIFRVPRVPKYYSQRPRNEMGIGGWGGGSFKSTRLV